MGDQNITAMTKSASGVTMRGFIVTRDAAVIEPVPNHAMRLKTTRSIAALTAFFQALGLRDDTDRSESAVMNSIATSTTNVRIERNPSPYPACIPMARTASFVR